MFGTATLKARSTAVCSSSPWLHLEQRSLWLWGA